MAATLTELPDDVLMRVLGFLTWGDGVSLMKTSRRFHRALHHEQLFVGVHPAFAGHGCRSWFTFASHMTMHWGCHPLELACEVRVAEEEEAGGERPGVDVLVLVSASNRLWCLLREALSVGPLRRQAEVGQLQWPYEGLSFKRRLCLSAPCHRANGRRLVTDGELRRWLPATGGAGDGGPMCQLDVRLSWLIDPRGQMTAETPHVVPDVHSWLIVVAWRPVRDADADHARPPLPQDPSMLSEEHVAGYKPWCDVLWSVCAQSPPAYVAHALEREQHPVRVIICLAAEGMCVTGGTGPLDVVPAAAPTTAGALPEIDHERDFPDMKRHGLPSLSFLARAVHGRLVQRFPLDHVAPERRAALHALLRPAVVPLGVVCDKSLGRDDVARETSNLTRLIQVLTRGGSAQSLRGTALCDLPALPRKGPAQEEQRTSAGDTASGSNHGSAVTSPRSPRCLIA